MAKKSNNSLLPGDVTVEVVAVKVGFKPTKKEMPYYQALKLPKKKGWRYIIYQLGFSQFNK